MTIAGRGAPRGTDKRDGDAARRDLARGYDVRAESAAFERSQSGAARGLDRGPPANSTERAVTRCAAHDE